MNTVACLRLHILSASVHRSMLKASTLFRIKSAIRTREALISTGAGVFFQSIDRKRDLYSDVVHTGSVLDGSSIPDSHLSIAPRWSAAEAADQRSTR